MSLELIFENINEELFLIFPSPDLTSPSLHVLLPPSQPTLHKLIRQQNFLHTMDLSTHCNLVSSHSHTHQSQQWPPYQ